jgi:hypothetical protein
MRDRRTSRGLVLLGTCALSLGLGGCRGEVNCESDGPRPLLARLPASLPPGVTYEAVSCARAQEVAAEWRRSEAERWLRGNACDPVPMVSTDSSLPAARLTAEEAPRIEVDQAGDVLQSYGSHLYLIANHEVRVLRRETDGAIRSVGALPWSGGAPQILLLLPGRARLLVISRVPMGYGAAPPASLLESFDLSDPEAPSPIGARSVPGEVELAWRTADQARWITREDLYSRGFDEGDCERVWMPAQGIAAPELRRVWKLDLGQNGLALTEQGGVYGYGQITYVSADALEIEAPAADGLLNRYRFSLGDELDYRETRVSPGLP